jgi:hypothetical protein
MEADAVITDLKPYSLILVCVIPAVRDMEIARLLGWYRIPFRSAPKVVDVDFLAFYQPSVFPAPEGGKINYLAQVKGHELTSRAELFREEIDSPRANEEYFKLQIGPLMQLDTPIEASSWKRITFLYTTGEYLIRAKTIQDLVVHSEERSILWRSLRERQQHTQDPYNKEEDNPLDPQITEWLGYLYIQTNHMNPGG